MNSKQVIKEINSVIRPILKENGFDKFTGRTYWRYKSDRIDILNFQSFNSYNAEVMGCNTFSFAVNLATFMNYIPIEVQIKEQNGLKRPEEYHGHFRSGITKGIKQQEFPEENIWFIDNNGKNLTKAISDCKEQIQKNAFEWYEQFEDKQNVLRILLEDHIDMKGTWGFGNMDSPNRTKSIAYTALELGQTELAIEKLQYLLGFLEKQYEQLKYDYYIERIKEVKAEIKNIKTIHNNV